MSELTPEYAATILLSTLKESLSELINAVVKAMADGSISGWEGFTLAQKAATLGTEAYGMVKTLPPEICAAIPQALLDLKLVPKEPEAPKFPWSL